MITTQILAETTKGLEKTIDSLQAVGDVIIGTKNPNLNFNCRIVGVGSNRSEARNKIAELSKTDWQFYLEPGEVLASGHDDLLSLGGEDARRVCVLTHDSLSKEIRIWKKGMKFRNPVCETIDVESKPINVFIEGTDAQDDLNDLLTWKKVQPDNKEIDYYLACRYLARKDHDQFIKYAKYFLFRETEESYSAVMTKYYLGLVNLYHRRDSHEAIKYLLMCLAEKPLMAEFWCAVGNCYYRAGVPDKAIEFFKNAIIMGQHRAGDDPYPIELSKYEEYPNKMIALCEELRRMAKDHSPQQ